MFALGLRVISALLLATMLMLVKLAGQKGVALPEIMFWRQAITVPLLLGYLSMTGGMHRLRSLRMGAHAKRAASGMIAMSFNFGAAILLPLAVSTTLGFTAPLFAVVIGVLFMGDKVGKWRLSAVLMGFAGILVITQPWDSPIPPLGAAAGLTSAFLIAIISHQIRDLGRTEEPVSVVFWFSVFGALLMTPILPFVMKPHSPEQWGLLLAIGLIGMLGQIFLTASLRLGAVASVIVMDYTSLIWATLFGWLIWDQFPHAATWLGAPIIILAGLTIVWREHTLLRPLSRTSAHDADVDVEPRSAKG